MFHNKGEADDYVYKLLQAFFLFSALLCCLSPFLTADFSTHLPCFSLRLCTQDGASPGKSYLTLLTLFTFLLWQIVGVRFTAIFRHRHPGTKHLKQNEID